MMGAMDQLEPIEKASVDELRALQRDRLRGSLKHAYEKVPHYRKAFDAAGVHPRRLKHPAELPQFPLPTQADPRANQPLRMFPVPVQEIVLVHASNATTRH